MTGDDRQLRLEAQVAALREVLERLRHPSLAVGLRLARGLREADRSDADDVLADTEAVAKAHDEAIELQLFARLMEHPDSTESYEVWVKWLAAHDRQLRLEGAREFVRRYEDALAHSIAPTSVLKQVLADMEAENAGSAGSAGSAG